MDIIYKRITYALLYIVVLICIPFISSGKAQKRNTLTTVEIEGIRNIVVQDIFTKLPSDTKYPSSSLYPLLSEISWFSSIELLNAKSYTKDPDQLEKAYKLHLHLNSLFKKKAFYKSEFLLWDLYSTILKEAPCTEDSKISCLALQEAQQKLTYSRIDSINGKFYSMTFVDYFKVAGYISFKNLCKMFSEQSDVNKNAFKKKCNKKINKDKPRFITYDFEIVNLSRSWYDSYLMSRLLDKNTELEHVKYISAIIILNSFEIRKYLVLGPSIIGYVIIPVKGDIKNQK